MQSQSLEYLYIVPDYLQISVRRMGRAPAKPIKTLAKTTNLFIISLRCIQILQQDELQ